MQLVPVETQRVRLEIGHAPALNFASEQSGVPAVTTARVTNLGGETIDGAELVISIQPSIAAPLVHRVPKLRPGETADLGALDVRVEPGRLRDQREAERGRLAWELRVGPTTLDRGEGRIDVLAFNEWAGLRVPPALLASFVTPNAPAVTLVLQRVRNCLLATTGDGAISGYQLRDPSRVRVMVRALYESIQSLGMSYVGAPASFEEIGQKVRLADALLADGMGNCLDLTVLVGSCLEQMGLSPLLVVQQRHAFPGVWLVEDRFHEGVVYDVSRLRNASSLGHVLFLDSSTCVQTPQVSFDAAVEVARRALDDDREFLCAVDVTVARRDRYLPLPLRDGQLQRPSPSPLSPFLETPPADVATPPNGHGAALVVVGGPSVTSGAGTSLSVRPGVAGGGGAGVPSNGWAGGAAGSQGGAASGAVASPVDARLRQWRERLLDLSLRNKLLNFRKDTKGVLALSVPDLGLFEDRLAADQPFEVHPRPAADARDQRDPKLSRARADGQVLAEAVASDFAKGIVHCPYDANRLAKQGVYLGREARTALEEGGANVLYAAVGFLRWYESDASQVERLAPLLLVPVAIEFVRTTHRVRFRRLPEDPLPNHTLIEKMRRDFGADLSALARLEPDESGVDVPAMLAGVRQAIQRLNRWEVIEEVHLGLFAFTKFLMWKDLEENAGALLENELVRHIVGGANTNFPERGRRIPPERLDDDVLPQKLPLVVDADSTQTAAIASALEGRSFVLQGPPGTGKSQTITNLIAVAIAAGKSVLFVSEKMAALDVVHRRLQKVGLGDFCLELHSHKAQKKQVVQALNKTLERETRRRSPDWDARSEDLAALRTRLNAYVRALHAPQPLGMSFHQANARLLALQGAPALRFTRADVRNLRRDDLKSAMAAASAFSTVASNVEPVATHPFRLCQVETWTAQRHQETGDALAEALVALDTLSAAAAALGARLGVQGPLPLASVERLAEALVAACAGPVPSAWRGEADWEALRSRVEAWADAGQAQASRRSQLAKRWANELYGSELDALAARFGAWAQAFFLLAWFFLFRARRRVRAFARESLPSNAEIFADLQKAQAARDGDEPLEQERRALARVFDGCWGGQSVDDLRKALARGDALRQAMRHLERATSTPSSDATTPAVKRALELADPACTPAERADFAATARAAQEALANYATKTEAVRRLLAPTPGAWPSDGPDHLRDVEKQLRAWSDMGAYRAWCQYRRACIEARAGGLHVVVDAHGAGTLRGTDAERAIEKALLTAWVAAARDAEPVLRDFDGTNHHRTVERFKEADKAHLELAQAHVVGSLETKLPRRGESFASTSEPGILIREKEKKRGHKALRKLIAEIPNLLTRLKPCLLMSPLSVAQYLPAKGRRFDLVVFDEASQIGPHDAIGAVARGDQVVIVGDSKQLPPTAFFQRGADDEALPTEDAVEDLESVLDQARAAGMPEQMLGWHYRSAHQDLIRFSNERYYDDRLHVFPAARGRVEDLGVKFHHVAGGVYDTGKTRQNRKEAEAIVAELVKAMRAHAPAERTFGVVAFSMAQAELVDELLEEAAGKHPEIAAHFNDDHPRHERVFVKNLENVQGDERDEVLFSIGYGPDERGSMAMQFGPLNREGGERRLNVAVTRARKQLRVFASFTYDKIDTNRTKAVGAHHLKAFLRFAADRTQDAAMAGGGEPSGDFDSDFERDVFDALRSLGHRVETQVGCGGYRIDLAVVHPEHPGVYALGVECDGAAYHSGATARDRDRLRQEVLEGLGWRLHRVWSTDWVYNRAQELERLEAAIELALRERASTPVAGQVVATRGESHGTGPSPSEATTEPAAEVEGATPRTPDAAYGREGAARAGGAGGTEGAAYVEKTHREELAQETPLTPYVRVVLGLVTPSPDEIHLPARLPALRALVKQVLDVEAPIHYNELTRRVGAAFGAQRVTDKLRARVLSAAQHIAGYTTVGDSLWNAAVSPQTYEAVRVPAPGDEPRDAAVIPVEEVAAAARWVLRQQLSMSSSELVRGVARLFGIQRVGQKVEERMREGLEAIIARGHAVERDGRIEWRGL
jgi:very-short-patch-repair endonuclease